MKRGDTGKTQGSATMARKPRGNQHASLRDKLERAAQGLYHGSESNYPYHFFCLPWDAEKDFTLENFLIRLGVSQAFLDDHQLSINDIASERPFEEFILGYQDPATADEPEVVSELKQRKKLIKVLKEKGPVRVPREFVFMDRAAIGLGGVFLHLGARTNWYRLFNETIEGFNLEEVERRQRDVFAQAGVPLPK